MRAAWCALALIYSCGSDSTDSPTEATDQKIVFVTSDTFTGDFGSDSDADVLCQIRAQNAGLAGSYRAWLSGSAGPSSQKVADARYVRTDGRTVANSRADFLDGSIANPINLDAVGNAHSGDVWTGTLADGSASDRTCSQWTIGDTTERGVCGSTAFVDGRWTDNLVPSCSTRLRLFCLEQ